MHSGTAPAQVTASPAAHICSEMYAANPASISTGTITPNQQPCVALLAVAFAYRSSTQIQADAGPFYFMGFNSYWMAATAGYGDGYLVHVDNVLDAAWVSRLAVFASGD